MNERTPSPDHQARQGMDYSETGDLQKVHAAIQREKTEPRVGLEPLSIWLVAVYGLAIFCGGAYLGRYSGNFSGAGLDPLGGAPRAAKAGAAGPAGGAQTAELSPADRGKKIFSANCATCHQATGLGVAGQYPPLAGSEYVMGNPRRLGMILLKGLEGPVTVKGAQYGSAVMQPWEKTLNDAKIADVLSYIRQEWGNTAPPVAPEGIGALRKELAGHPGSFHEPDLKAVPDDANLPGGEGAAPPKPAPNAPAPPPKA
ncbi:MAG: cytochrome c [Verrucomicrobiota bacterium]|nr:cytochrome c [Verrucomicrobiota bacterium]